MLRTLSHLFGAGLLTTTLFGGIPVTFVLSAPMRAVEIRVAEPAESEVVSFALPAVGQGAEAEVVQTSEPALPTPVVASTKPGAASVAPPPVALAARATTGPGRMTRSGSGGQASAGGERSGSSGAAKQPRRQCLTPPAGIQSMGGNSYQVDQRLFDSYTSSLNQVMELGRATPHQTGAGVVGYRLVRVRCGSPLHAAGMRRGDVVHSVNGMPVRSIPQALLAFSKLRSSRNFTLRISRKGAPMTLRYRLI